MIYALFYEEKTERAYAKQIGVSPSTVHRRKEEIKKTEKIFEIAEQTSHLTANKVRGLFWAFRSLTNPYSFIKYVPVVIVMSVSHVSGTP